MSNLTTREFSEGEKDTWDSFINDSYSGDIIQFWGWGETKRDQGWLPYRVGVVNEYGDLVLAAQCLLKKAGFLGNYLYIGHGPVFNKKENLITALPKLVEFLRSKTKELNIFGIEIDPRFGKLAPEENDTSRITENIKPMIDPEILKILISSGFKLTGRNMQPIYKLYYDLSLQDDELLAMMKKNTRYNIGLAERKGIKITEYLSNEENIESRMGRFYNLMQEMQQRAKGYPIRPITTFRKLLNIFEGSNNISLFEATFEEDLIASNISQRTKHWSSSFYAGSNRLHSEKKAPYLLRWRSIQKAKEHGSKVYDFWGIIPNSKQHEGYSDTKLSFGGVRIDDYGILAYPFNRFKYFLWHSFLKIRKHIFFLR